MGDLIESLRVGAFTYETFPFKQARTHVQLWMDDADHPGQLVFGGAMEMLGRFHNTWTAKVGVGDEILESGGSNYEGFLKSSDYGKCPLRVTSKFFKKPELQIEIAKNKWIAAYPRTLLTDGPRTSDRKIEFCGDGRSIPLWIFPAEQYDLSRLLPSTRPIINAATIGNNNVEIPLIKTLIAASLIGYSLYR